MPPRLRSRAIVPPGRTPVAAPPSAMWAAAAPADSRPNATAVSATAAARRSTGGRPGGPFRLAERPVGGDRDQRRGAGLDRQRDELPGRGAAGDVPAPAQRGPEQHAEAGQQRQGHRHPAADEVQAGQAPSGGGPVPPGRGGQRRAAARRASRRWPVQARGGHGRSFSVDPPARSAARWAASQACRAGGQGREPPGRGETGPVAEFGWGPGKLSAVPISFGCTANGIPAPRSSAACTACCAGLPGRAARAHERVGEHQPELAGELAPADRPVAEAARSRHVEHAERQAEHGRLSAHRQRLGRAAIAAAPAGRHRCCPCRWWRPGWPGWRAGQASHLSQLRRQRAGDRRQPPAVSRVQADRDPGRVAAGGGVGDRCVAGRVVQAGDGHAVCRQPGGAGQAGGGSGQRQPATAMTAAARRRPGPPARAGRPVRPRTAAAIPARNMIRAIGRSGSHG